MKETPAVDKPLFSEPPSSANVAASGQDETIPEEEHFLVQPTFSETTAPAAVKKSKKRKVDVEKEEYESVDKTACEIPQFADLGNSGQDETLPGEEHFLVQPTFSDSSAPAAVKKSKKRKVDAEKEEYESVDKTASEIPQFADLSNSVQDETLPGEEQFLVQPTCCDSTAPAAVRRGKKRKGEYEAAKPRRAWELWSKDDKLFFFEGSDTLVYFYLVFMRELISCFSYKNLGEL